MSEEITVDIKNGVPTVSVKGVKGTGCKALTKELEQALGEAESTHYTAEAREQSQQQSQQTKQSR